MQAAVLECVQKLFIKQKEIPRCKAGEVLLQVKACSICRTDLKCYELGHRDLKLPRVLGHEIAGIVVETGSGVDKYKKGDRVQVSPGISCGHCEFCLQGRDNLCRRLKIMGFNYDGGFAEYLLVPAEAVLSGVLNMIPPHLSYEEASMTEPLACSLNMQEALKITSSDTVLIFGAGRLGILNALLARNSGAKKIFVVEPLERRLEQAEKYGFAYLFNPAKSCLYREIMAITNNRGVDVVIPCCPAAEAFNSGLHLLAAGGRFGFFSGLLPGDKMKIDLNLVHYKELTMFGAYGCTSAHNKQALSLLASGALNVKKLLSQVISLEEVEKGLKMIKTLSQLSVVVSF